MRRFLLLVTAALGVVLFLPELRAGATGSAVYDAGPVQIPKADYQVNPNIPANEKIAAADWNQLGQYMLDAATAIRWGWYHGLAPQTAKPPAPDSGILLFNLADGGGLWIEYPDAGVQEVPRYLSPNAAAYSGDDFVLDSMVTRTAGRRLVINNFGSPLLTLDYAGNSEFTGAVQSDSRFFRGAPDDSVHLQGDVIDGDTVPAVILEPLGSTLLTDPVAQIRDRDAGTLYEWSHVRAYSARSIISDGGVTAAQGVTSSTVTALGANTEVVTGTMADGASAVAVAVDTSAAYSTAGAKLVSFRNHGTEKVAIYATGTFTGEPNIIAGCWPAATSPGSTHTTIMQNSVPDTATLTRANYRVVKSVAGVGAGTMTLELYDRTTTTSLATFTVPCTGTGLVTPTSSSGLTIAGTDNLEAAFNATGECSTYPGFCVQFLVYPGL